MFDLLKDTVAVAVTPTHLAVFALGAIGAIVSYRAGNRMGHWVYDKHLSKRLPKGDCS